jgi:hypothetical protein
MSITTNITANISASNLTNVTQPLLNISPNISTNYSGNITSNITTNITANLSSNLSNITSNQTNTTIVANLTNVTTQVNTTSNLTTNDSSMSTYSQRVLDLVVAKRFLAENENSTRVFVIYENSTASINLSHYFIDLDNLSLKFELQPVNASKMTSVIDKDLLTLAPQESFVGLQTFRISATNSANLSTLSPLLTLIVLDEMPSQPLSRSIQIGLLVLLIIIAIIIYFDIRLISKQYTHAKQTQDEHKKKK